MANAMMADKRRPATQHTFHLPEPGPSLRAVPFTYAPDKALVRLLSRPQRLALAGIATREQLTARTIVYHADTVAEHVFIVERGMLKSYRDLPSGKRRIAAFWVAEDIFGMAEAGRYVNTLQAVTPVSLYRMRLDRLMDLLRRDPELECQILCKLTHEIREAYRHTILVTRRDAPGRVAMFLRTLAEQLPRERHADVIPIPMSRSDIAAYLGISLEAVSRACRKLEKSGIVKFDGLHAARILDRAQFDKLASAL